MVVSYIVPGGQLLLSIWVWLNPLCLYVGGGEDAGVQFGNRLNLSYG